MTISEMGRNWRHRQVDDFAAMTELAARQSIAGFKAIEVVDLGLRNIAGAVRAAHLADGRFVMTLQDFVGPEHAIQISEEIYQALKRGFR